MLLEGVFGGQGLGAHGADEGLLSGVHPLVDQQGVLLGEGLPTHSAPKRLLSWSMEVRGYDWIVVTLFIFFGVVIIQTYTASVCFCVWVWE